MLSSQKCNVSNHGFAHKMQTFYKASLNEYDSLKEIVPSISNLNLNFCPLKS